MRIFAEAPALRLGLRVKAALRGANQRTPPGTGLSQSRTITPLSLARANTERTPPHSWVRGSDGASTHTTDPSPMRVGASGYLQECDRSASKRPPVRVLFSDYHQLASPFDAPATAAGSGYLPQPFAGFHSLPGRDQTASVARHNPDSRRAPLSGRGGRQSPSTSQTKAHIQ
jgi:hypothetical protein